MNLNVTLLCKVVDNFGDAGICARLARQLAVEHGCRVQIWSDQPELVMLLLGSGFHNDLAGGSVEVDHWAQPFASLSPPGDMVIEAFACGTPPELIAAMKAQSPQPVWVNLEYLTTEPWADGCHLNTSPHPSSGLIQHFFFPGFSHKTGGLIREKKLPLSNDIFAQLGVSQPAVPGELRLSLFCYPAAPIDNLCQALSTSPHPVRLFTPDGVRATAGGNLTIHPFGFVTQRDYDRLLAACDLNFVRGEDSFIRAHWAAKPLIWQPYIQPEDAHLAKLNGWMDQVTPFLSAEDAKILALAHEVWNVSAGDWREIWPSLSRCLPSLKVGMQRWTESLMKQDDLASQLLALIQTQGQVT